VRVLLLVFHELAQPEKGSTTRTVTMTTRTRISASAQSNSERLQPVARKLTRRAQLPVDLDG
jgi:hypothetical protein